MLKISPRAAFLSSFGAGLLCGILFSIAIGSELGVIVLLLLPLPFLVIGLSQGARHTGTACAVAMGISALILGPAEMIFMAWFIALPSYFLVRRLLQWRMQGVVQVWYPVLRALTELTLIAAGSVMMLSIITRGDGGLHSLLPHGIGVNLTQADPDFAATMQQLPEQMGFLMIATAGALCVLVFYGLAVLANRILATKHLSLRPTLALSPGGLPWWLLLLLAASALVSAIGQGDERMAGESIFVLLLLPYLLSGIASAHAYSITRHVPMRRLWIACFYVALIFGRWPLLLVIGMGLYTQLAEILDRRKKMG